MTEYILTRHQSDGKISYSWGPKEKQFGGPLITWNHKWLRREAFKLKKGESKTYFINQYGSEVIGCKDEKVKDFLIDVYFWLTEDWKYDLRRLKATIKQKWEYLWLPRQEKEELKHMWDGIRIVPMYVKSINADLVSEQPLPTENIPHGKLCYFDLITNDNNNKKQI